MSRWLTLMGGVVVVALAGTFVRAQSSATFASEVAGDRRFEAPRTLRGTFTFEPPASEQAWAARARAARRQVQVSLGLWPMPEATPLNAVVHGRVARNGYTVDKVSFESVPGHFVTGSLYRPAGREGRLPAVLLPHGHWQGGRFNEASIDAVRKSIVSGAERFEVGGRYPLQAAAVQLARMGVISLLFDLEGYADSVQIPIQVAHGEPDGRPADSPAAPGLFFAADTESRLESIMGLQSWNARRALDFLASLPDVDPARLAVSGASGGGTQTFILGALDDRPVTLFPMVMVGTGMQGGCTCENADYLRIGIDNVDIAALAAPKPMGMTSADDWTKTMPETGFPGLKRLWTLLKAPDDVAIFPFPQFPHNYNYVSRSAMYAWMNQRLHLGLAEPVVEEDYVPLTRAEASVWDAGHPAPGHGEAEERSVTSWWTSEGDRQLAGLAPHDATSLARYREVVGGALAVMVARDTPGDGDVVAQAGTTTRPDGIVVSQGLLKQARYGEVTPFVLLTPPQATGDIVVWLDPTGTAAVAGADGAPSPLATSLLAKGRAVMGLDVFETGAFRAAGASAPAKNTLVKGPPIGPYTYGYNSPLVIERVHDVLAALRYARTRATRHVALAGLGADAGVWATIARAAAPSLVDRLAVDTGGFRFASVTTIDDARFLPGGVKYGDVPALLALGAPGPLWLAGEGAQAPAIVAVAYQSANAPSAFRLSPTSGDRSQRSAIEWLVAP